MWRMRPPSLVTTFFEAAWLVLELASLPLTKSMLRGEVPDGDGSPVLVLPGILNNDVMTAPLRGFIEELGYKTYAWDGGLNIGFSKNTAKHLADRLDKIYRDTGKKVALVGHSLGGIYARELARQFPHKVSKVITMGSAFGADKELQAITPALRLVFRAASFNNPHITDQAIIKRSLIPPPVPTTSIFSRTDGLVDWHACLNPKARRAENIEVQGGHVGVFMNPGALLALADRLAAPVRGWKPFDPSQYDIGYGNPTPYTGEVPERPRMPRNIPNLFI
ncbi:MAG TPA: alpha/beta hydrolase [Patescibacteria group bacterium]|nr:alpha/beta hydrolase [Patescibacteria group bacterium]